MPAKELPKANCYSRYSCSKLLLTTTFPFGLVTKCCSH